MTRYNIILTKRAVPKKLTLPNVKTFYTKYERIRRSNLPSNVRVAQRKKPRVDKENNEVAE